VEQVLRDIDAAQHALNTSAAGLFELEDRLSSAQDSLDANLERVRAAQERLNESVFRRTGASVWDIALAASRGALSPPRAHGEYIISGLRAFWGSTPGACRSMRACWRRCWAAQCCSPGAHDGARSRPATRRPVS
jgi:hypothetical protein